MEGVFAGILAVLFIGTALVSDIRSMIISNKLNIAFFASGIIVHAAMSGLTGGVGALLGAAAGMFPLLLLYLLKGIGAGDVKFFAALGAVIGVGPVLQILMYAILYGGVFGLVMLLINRSFSRRFLFGAMSIVIAESKVQAWETSFANKKALRFPFMIAVVPGALTALYFMLI
ncbi:prepilin peptidase [Paenibacillus sp. R14(2021)]|uniref:A24 family peptidase n=1 Tax=Paenibacillus sp. R14(2021) TaxID=2859228 RepID=UPI001C611DC1|nr:prepilin peptidase [Paenibacillus sp. R14(2021)]